MAKTSLLRTAVTVAPRVALVSFDAFSCKGLDPGLAVRRGEVYADASLANWRAGPTGELLA